MFIRDYFRVLIPLLALMAVHRFALVPWIEPKLALTPAFLPNVTEDTSTAWWQGYFVEGSWQRNSPKVLETPRGILIFQEWKQLSKTRWKISPLTILIPQEDEPTTGNGISVDGATVNAPSRRAIFVENPQGAEIQFKEPIDLTSGKPPPPVLAGQLNGPIRIYSPPKIPGEDGLIIDTRDLRIDRKNITTTQRVSMKIGRSRIEGRDLSIHLDNTLLATSEIKNTPKEDSPFEGLDFLELIYVDRVDIDLPPGGLFKKQPTDGSTLSATEGPAAKAEVLCDNAFRFDFHRSIATLSGNVRMRHRVAELPEDVFQSDQLSLHFQSARDWTIDIIEALGSNSHDNNDPMRWVQIDAPSLQARGQGRWLKVDLNQGRVAIANHLPASPPTDSSRVYLEQETMRVWSPEIEYESDSLKQQIAKRKGSSSEGEKSIVATTPKDPNKPARLGKIWAAGPGRAEVASDDGDQWGLSWAESLQLQPEGELDRLTISGSANAKSTTQGRFIAEKVDIWLRSLAPEVVDELAITQGGKRPSSVIPQRLHAVGKTIVDSPQLRAQVTDMQVWFAYPDIEAVQGMLARETPETRSQRRGKRLQMTLQPSQQTSSTSSASSPIGNAFSGLADIASSVAGKGESVVKQEVATTASPPSSPQVGRLASIPGRDLPSQAPSQLHNSANAPATMVEGYPLQSQTPKAISTELPMNVTGESLKAKISRSVQGLVIDDLSLTGFVTVTRNQISPDSPMPLTITGNQLRIDTSDGGQFDALVSGDPASLAVGNASLSGPEVRFNQRNQMVWIDHPGVFRIPPEAMRASMTGNSNNLSSNSTSSNVNATTNIASQESSQRNPSSAPQLLQGNDSSTSEKWIEPPEVTWNRRMVFDGRVARMDGGVQITGRVQTDADTVWHLLGTASEMQVELKEPIRLIPDEIGPSKSGPPRPRSASTKTEVDRIRLINQVDLKGAQTDIQGNRRSLEHIQVPELIFLVPKQEFESTGPGQLRSRRLGNPSQGSPLIGNPITNQNSQQASLQCLHLTFQGRMQGFIQNERITFYDRVEALLGTIITWENSIDVQKVDQLPIGNTRMICDELSVYNTSNLSYNKTRLANNHQGNDAAWEVSGNGRVKVDSNTDKGSYSIDAQSFTYAGIYNKLTIKGLPGNPARIQHFNSANDPNGVPNETYISEGNINLKTGESQLSVSRSTINLDSLQATPRPPGANQGVQAPLASPRDSYPRPRSPINRKEP